MTRRGGGRRDRMREAQKERDKAGCRRETERKEGEEREKTKPVKINTEGGGGRREGFKSRRDLQRVWGRFLKIKTQPRCAETQTSAGLITITPPITPHLPPLLFQAHPFGFQGRRVPRSGSAPSTTLSTLKTAERGLCLPALIQWERDAERVKVQG